MRRYLAGSLLLLFACAGEEQVQTEENTSSESADEAAIEGQAGALAQLDAEGHTIYFYEPTPGALLVAEKRGLDEARLLDRVTGRRTPAAIYAQLSNGPVPQALLDFEQRAPGTELDIEPASEDASVEQGAPILKHEAGSTHFREAHCPTVQDPIVWSLFRHQVERDWARQYTNILTRQFCWASNHIGNWTESATAAVFTHSVSALTGDVCYTASWDTGSRLFTVLAGEQWDFWYANTPAKWDVPNCPRGAVCGYVTASKNATMRGAISCTEGGKQWRFGGVFHKQALTKFEGNY
jgi:hypothetical protein